MSEEISSSGGAGTVTVPPHSHCEICQKAVKQGTRFCSTECEEKHEELLAQKKKSMWKFIAILAALMLFFTALRMGWL